MYLPSMFPVSALKYRARESKLAAGTYTHVCLHVHIHVHAGTCIPVYVSACTITSISVPAHADLVHSVLQVPVDLHVQLLMYAWCVAYWYMYVHAHKFRRPVHVEVNFVNTSFSGHGLKMVLILLKSSQAELSRG